MTDTRTCQKQVQRVTVILAGVIAIDDFYLLTDVPLSLKYESRAAVLMPYLPWIAAGAQRIQQEKKRCYI